MNGLSGRGRDGNPANGWDPGFVANPEALWDPGFPTDWDVEPAGKEEPPQDARPLSHPESGKGAGPEPEAETDGTAGISSGCDCAGSALGPMIAGGGGPIAS
jgi:hypothetical protein